MKKPKKNVSAPGVSRAKVTAPAAGRKTAAKKGVKAAGAAEVSSARSGAAKPAAKEARAKTRKGAHAAPKPGPPARPAVEMVTAKPSPLSVHVLYCLLREIPEGESLPRFLLVSKNGSMTFPCTRMRDGEDLFESLRRPLIGDLGLPKDSYFPETELSMIRGYGGGSGGADSLNSWFLYPVDVSLTDEGWAALPSGVEWWTLEEIAANSKEPNVKTIANHLRETWYELLSTQRPAPTMNALASHWAAHNRSGVRVLRDPQLQKILEVGDRAFNLRVVDPYLPYQKQGLGFTWSFFTPKDGQDVHVHGMPMVEIYGVLKGCLQIWYKFINQRGAQVWRRVTLEEGDWAEVEPLHCHLAIWLDPDGLGTVFRAGGQGSLAGVGKLGNSGKTTCKDCYKKGQCMRHPLMKQLADQYSRPFKARDYSLIAEWGRS